MADSCHAANYASTAPFVFFKTLANGSHLSIAPSYDTGTGLCYYPSANCLHGQRCCSISPWVKDANAKSTQIINMASPVIFFGCICFVTRWLDQIRNRLPAVSGESRNTTSRPPSGLPERLNMMGIYLGVTAVTTASIIMADSTQLALPVPQRNSMLAAVAFLTPVKEVFQFLEDTTTVKITHAMGTGDYSPIRSIAYVGVVGGVLAGVAGAALMTVLAAWPSAIEVLLAPGAAQATDDNPGCDLLPTAAEVVDNAKILWFMTSWAWPLQFVAMVLTGLLMGAREFGLYGLASVLAQATMLVTWFLGPKPQNLDLLGWSGFMASLVFCLSLALAILANRPLRQKYGLLFCVREVAAEGASQSLNDNDSVQKNTLLDGLLAMTLDLVLQAGISIAVFVAGFLSLQDMYQLSAAGAALPQYTAYAAGLGYIVKLSGSALVGRKAYREFATLMRVIIGLSAMLGIVSALGIFPLKSGLAAFYSSQACEFASSKKCLGIYRGIFGGGVGTTTNDSTMFDTFTAFGVTTMFTCVFSVAKAALYACQDFVFMAKSSLVIFVVFFIPALLIARLHFATATALYVAQMLPTWCLTVVFLLRLPRKVSQMIRKAEEDMLASIARSIQQLRDARAITQGTASQLEDDDFARTLTSIITLFLETASSITKDKAACLFTDLELIDAGHRLYQELQTKCAKVRTHAAASHPLIPSAIQM
eukprot:TRINITY_DN22007_c0_g2_i1.p1 TRINITY_DN22007_c0_g2~~TRINITY_DN22007_c0_g2_i1.p1  ORF type:complete len:715 (+),score=95.09 TRINITY_DN22007_c0_g2_i1:30-2147(+)